MRAATERQSTGSRSADVIRPGATIGILGGGQLGRMIALEGRKMGYRFAVMDPTPDAPCAQVADIHVQADFDNVEGALRLAEQSDVITYEFENVDAQVAAVLEAHAYIPQGSQLLRITQDRLNEKRSLEALGVPIAPYREIRSFADLVEAVEALGFPAVLKTVRGGYDGKGQRVLGDKEQLQAAYQSLSEANVLVLEQYIPFEKELSVIVARGTKGEMAAFPAAENIHRENILHMSIVPARVSDEVSAEAERLGLRIAEGLRVVGLIAVEMFLTGDGRLLVNELAPRPHNSGHYTYDACVTSQFEQHLRAVCGLSLGLTRLLSPVVMVNILGEHLSEVMRQVEHLPPSVKLHLYGKAAAKPKRKMGHINVIAEETDEALQIIEKIGIWT